MQSSTVTRFFLKSLSLFFSFALCCLFSLQIARAQTGTNLALNKPASQSSTLADPYNPIAERAVDGNTGGNYFESAVTHTESNYQAWWQVDLGSIQSVGIIKIWNRTDCCGE